MPAPSSQCKTTADCSPWCLIDSFCIPVVSPQPLVSARPAWVAGWLRAGGWLGGCAAKQLIGGSLGSFQQQDVFHTCLPVCVWKNAKMVISHMDWYRFTNTREGVVKIWDNLAVVVFKLVTSEYARVTVKKDIHIPPTRGIFGLGVNSNASPLMMIPQ